ncbi:MAG: IS110 family transposase [Acidobacteriota bacterium]|nr:MAG: IS110 family transposase [Acidobacteriota bacterium]
MRFFSKTTRATDGPRWFGIDLAKRESQISVLDAGGVQIETKRFATTRESFLLIAAELREGDTAALEVTTNSTSIARLLRGNSQARVIVSNPIKTKTIAQAKIKTDKIDARVLAELARVGYLPEVWLPDEDTEALRQFITDRVSLVRRRTECKNTIHSVLHRNMVHQERSDLFGTSGRRWLENIIRGEGIKTPVPELDRMRIGSLLNEIDRIDALVADLESVIASYVALRPHLKEQMDRLLSITGVNLVVASSLIGTIGDIGRFPDKKKLAAYFGVVPSTYQSGDTSRNGRITKQGRAEARWLIIEAAEILRRSPGPMRALYSRIQRKRNHNVAVVAVARKLVELVHHLLSNREDYVYKLPRLTMEKRSRWRFLAKKKLGIEIKSAAAKRGGRSALYGTGIDVQGRKLKSQITKQAAADAERLYAAIVDQRKRHLDDPSSPLIPSTDLLFDPTSPSETDWERILSQHTERLLLRYQKREATRSKSTPRPDIA